MRYHAFGAALALAFMFAGGSALAAGKPTYFAAHYACDDGLRIRVAYPVDYLAGHGITLRYGGRQVNMRPALSASGARYENRSRHLEWFIKGDDGMLIDTGADRTIHCKTVSASP
ncbi:MAG TPA: MliC family protein [Burkholderiaceae bacterium]|nr:MliC family protein [Burkholderiaceae bacterium]